jgi:hypothetical protein
LQPACQRSKAGDKKQKEKKHDLDRLNAASLHEASVLKINLQCSKAQEQEQQKLTPRSL